MSENKYLLPPATLILHIELTTKSLSSVDNASTCSWTDRKALLAAAKSLVSALEPPNAELWRVVFAVG